MSFTGDFVYSHGSPVHVVRCCQFENAPDLVAVGGGRSVDVLSCDGVKCRVVARFYTGSSATALAWSPEAVRVQWLRLVVSGSNGTLHHLTKDGIDGEEITASLPIPFTNQKGSITDLTFCGDLFGQSAGRFLTSITDYMTLILWDLRPDLDAEDRRQNSAASRDSSYNPLLTPSVKTLLFSSPLHTVTPHRGNPNLLLVSESRGSVHLVDWQSAWRPDDAINTAGREDSASRWTVASFVDPITVAKSVMGAFRAWSGSISQNPDNEKLLGGAFGDRWVLWDQSRGIQPVSTGAGFAGGSRRFRWCPTDANIFALSPLQQSHGAIIHIHNLALPNAAPAQLTVSPQPHQIADFDWLGSRFGNSPVVVVADLEASRANSDDGANLTSWVNTSRWETAAWQGEPTIAGLYIIGYIKDYE